MGIQGSHKSLPQFHEPVRRRVAQTLAAQIWQQPYQNSNRAASLQITRLLVPRTSTESWIISRQSSRRDSFLPCRKYTAWKQLRNQGSALVWIWPLNEIAYPTSSQTLGCSDSFYARVITLARSLLRTRLKPPMYDAPHQHSAPGQTTVPTKIAHPSPRKGQTKIRQPHGAIEICTGYQKSTPKIIHIHLRRDVAPARVIKPSITCQEKPSWSLYISPSFLRANPWYPFAFRPLPDRFNWLCLQ